MFRFNFHPTPLSGLMLVERVLISDERGFLARIYCAEEFRVAGWNKPIDQINHTLTRKRGAVRGMHFQYPPFAESKLVTCLKGQVFDVAVDLRHGSPTLLQWHSEILSAENHSSLLVPEGFAHGFQALNEDCELLYLHTAPFNAEAEGALNVADPRLAIAWPLPIADHSDRDCAHPFIGTDFSGIHA